MNKDCIKVEIPVNVRFEFDRKKFAEYMCRNIEQGTEEYNLVYKVCYRYPNEQCIEEDDVRYMLDNGILVRLDEDEIDSEHIDEYLHDIE